MTYSAALGALLGFHIVWGLVVLYRYYFRKNIKIGDVVNVAFGDYILVRKVVRVTKDEVLVTDFEEKGLMLISKSKVYCHSNIE